MVKKNIKKSIVLILSISLISGAALAGGCLGIEIENPPEPPPTQTIKDITPEEAFALIQENQHNSDFVIFDYRTSEEFAKEHIENAINLDYYSDIFQDVLNQLDKNKTYLIYDQNEGRSGEALDMMAEINFREVYNMLGGITQWAAEGFPTIQATQQIIEDIIVQEAFALILKNQNNPYFVIIDIRTPEEFADEHIENAINIDYSSETFQDELDQLDKDNIYLVYDQNGGYSADALDMMVELNFSETYNMLGGITQWTAQELPTTQGQEIVTQIFDRVTVHEAFTLIQENQDNPDFIIIDLRPPEEFVEGHIEDAINIYYESETFQDELDQLDKDKTYLIYWSCACGRRSDKTQDMMEELNFRAVYNMRRGSDIWTAEGYPLVK